jgi:hypothetical protein
LNTLFWTDPCLLGRPISDWAPDVFVVLSGSRLWRRRTVAAALTDASWLRDIAGALTVAVIMQYLMVREQVDNVVLDASTRDTVRWKWCSSGSYSAKSAYSISFIGQTALMGAKELRKISAPSKCKMFLWLVLQDLCWTSKRLQRHGLDNHGSCALCSQSAETLDHLLLSCSYSREVWFKALRRASWQQAMPGMDDSIATWWLRSRKRVLKSRRKAFDSLFALVCWKLWSMVVSSAASPWWWSSFMSVIWVELELWCKAKLVRWS